MSPSLSPAPTPRPPSLEGGAHHSCGCHAKGVVRLQSASGDLRSTIGEGQGQTDVLGTVLDVAVIGGAAYLVYELFFGD